MIKGKWVKSPWTISIGTAILSFILTIIYDYSKNKPIADTFGKVLKFILNIIIYVLNIKLKVWWLLIALISIIYLIMRFQHGEDDRPEFYNYREDILKKWKWTWSWRWSNYENAWLITDLEAHCPNCETSLIQSSSIYGIRFDCPRCNFRANEDNCEQPYVIEAIILDNIKRKKRDKSTLNS
ncbi:MAG: hypothetical protein Q8920_04250 [Bacillota bacterium]|nr:hypothetical protein [Bacillota bacterium]